MCCSKQVHGWCVGGELRGDGSQKTAVMVIQVIEAGALNRVMMVEMKRGKRGK